MRLGATKNPVPLVDGVESRVVQRSNKEINCSGLSMLSSSSDQSDDSLLSHSNVIFMLAAVELSTKTASKSPDSQTNSTPSSTAALLGSTFFQISLNFRATPSIA